MTEPHSQPNSLFSKMQIFLAGLAIVLSLVLDYMYTARDSKEKSAQDSANNTTLPVELNLLKMPLRVTLQPDVPCERDVKLAILVMVRPYGAPIREAIRQTWGRELNKLSDKVRIFFIIGIKGEKIPSFLPAEKRWTDDLVVIRFEESYANLTLKTMLALRWANTFCPSAEFVMKSDDDVIIFPSIITFIDELSAEKGEGKIWGKCFLTAPDRDPTSKWYISWELWPQLHYPIYCSGHGFLMSGIVASQLIAEASDSDIFPVEDVFYTGIIAEKLGIPRIDVPEFRTSVSPEDACNTGAYTVHRVQQEGVMRKFWLAYRAYCKKGR